MVNFRSKDLVYLLYILVFAVALGLAFKGDNSDDNIDSSQFSLDPVAHSYGSGGRDVVIKEDEVWKVGSYEFNSFEISKGTLDFEGNEKQIEIRATSRIIIKKDAILDITDGSTNKPSAADGRGGSFGGPGGVGDCRQGEVQFQEPAYDVSRVTGGSGFLRAPNSEYVGGEGAGYLLLAAPEIIIKGKIRAIGTDGVYSVGGGSGGKVIIISDRIINNGHILVSGGAGAKDEIQGYGGGGGGLVLVSRKPEGDGLIDVAGGKGGAVTDLYSGCNGGMGSSGKVLIAS